jgi:CrcB protein
VQTAPGGRIFLLCGTPASRLIIIPIVVKMNILIIGTGGFVGAILRYLVSGWAHRITGASFPYGTLTVNVIGSLLLGFFLVIAEGRFIISPQIRGFISIGLLGAFTTYSTYSFETIMLFKEMMYTQAILNITLNLVLGLFAVWIGITLARLI